MVDNEQIARVAKLVTDQIGLIGDAVIGSQAVTLALFNALVQRGVLTNEGFAAELQAMLTDMTEEERRSPVALPIRGALESVRETTTPPKPRGWWIHAIIDGDRSEDDE